MKNIKEFTKTRSLSELSHLLKEGWTLSFIDQGQYVDGDNATISIWFNMYREREPTKQEHISDWINRVHLFINSSGTSSESLSELIEDCPGKIIVYQVEIEHTRHEDRSDNLSGTDFYFTVKVTI